MIRLLFLLGAAVTASAAINGVAVNRTTGEPVPRIPITLISFAQGMDPIEEVYTDADGRFAFVKEVSGGPAMLRSEFEGVSYSKMIPPGTPQQGVEVEVFNAAEEPIPPTGRVLVLEPGESQIVINESYLFENNTSPPKTYRDAERGTLRFYLPPAAKGVVQVEASGPARMPLKQVADPTSEQDIYKVDFAIKPGENRISLTYLLPHESGESLLEGRTVYNNLQTRIAVPAGVELKGEGLTSLGKEPTTQAEIFEVAAGPFAVTVVGSGRLSRSNSAPASGGGAAGGAPTEISIEQAPISKEAPWVFGIAGAILALGFLRLFLLGDGGKRS